MKKLILLMLALSLVSLSLFACGNPEESSSSESGSESSSETQSGTQKESETEWNDPDWTPPVK